MPIGGVRMFEDYDEVDDSEAPMVMIGFLSFDDLLQFITWAHETFDDPEDLQEYFSNMAVSSHNHSYKECTRDASLIKKFEHVCDVDDCGYTFVSRNGLKMHKRVAHGIDEDRDFWDIINSSYTNHHKEIRDNLRNSD